MSDLRTLGRYQIEGFLGKGSFAEVYKATDTILKRVVALKVLKPALMADEEAYRSAYRFSSGPTNAGYLFGFRCALLP